MILLKTLTIKDFLSHEETKIEFRENEKILLDGKSGSGKSSITEAILWCLYGRGRTDGRSLIRRGTKATSVSIKFIDEEMETIITRTVSSAGKNGLTITRNVGTGNRFLPIERTGLKDHQDWIEKEFLKASYELFTNSVAYPQENENSFVKSTASRRKDLLLEIVRADNFENLYEKTREKLTENEKENAVINSNISIIENNLLKLAETAQGITYYDHEVKQTSHSIEEKTLLEKDLEKKATEISTVSHQISEKKLFARNLVSAMDDIDVQLKADERTVSEYQNLDITTARINIEEMEKLSVEVERIDEELKENAKKQMVINVVLANKPHVHDYSKEIEDMNKRLIPLIKDSGKCPAGDACPFIEPIKGQIEFLSEQIADKTFKSEESEKDMEKWAKEYTALVPVTDTTELYASSLRIKNRIKELSSSKEVITKYEMFQQTLETIHNRTLNLNTRKKELSAQLFDIDKNIQQLGESFVKFDSNQINIDLASIRIELQQLQKKKENMTLELSLAIKAQEEIKEASTRLLELKKGILKGIEDATTLELLKEALSPRGIKAVVIDYLVPQLEDRINGVLGQMSDFRIRLDTQQEKASEDGTKEGLFITVINDRGEELPFQSYSGGEKVKIIVAISEALASLLSSVGFRLMDENIISLDSESTQGFVDVLMKLQNKFPQLLIISHLQEIKDLFEKRVTIIKTNGVSRII